MEAGDIVEHDNKSPTGEPLLSWMMSVGWGEGTGAAPSSLPLPPLFSVTSTCKMVMNGFRHRSARRPPPSPRQDRNLIKGKATESGLASPG